MTFAFWREFVLIDDYADGLLCANSYATLYIYPCCREQSQTILHCILLGSKSVGFVRHLNGNLKIGVAQCYQLSCPVWNRRSYPATQFASFRRGAFVRNAISFISINDYIAATSSHPTYPGASPNLLTQTNEGIASQVGTNSPATKSNWPWKTQKRKFRQISVSPWLRTLHWLSTSNFPPLISCWSILFFDLPILTLPEE